jgi:hypothetical protein
MLPTGKEEISLKAFFFKTVYWRSYQKLGLTFTRYLLARLACFVHQFYKIVAEVGISWKIMMENE